MAASIGSLVLKLAVDSQALYSGLASASQRVASFGASAARTLAAPFSSAASSLGSFGLASQGLSAIRGLFADTLGESVRLAASMEQTSMAFEVMTGNAERGRALLEGLTRFSMGTPFEPTAIIDTGRKLLGYGVQAERVVPTIKVLGDVASGSGKDLGELAVIFGQIRAAGRLLGQDANQLAQAGIPIIAKLAEHYGATTAKVMEMKEAGQVSFRDVALVLQKMSQAGGNYANMMERQSTTLLGLWSTLAGNVKLAMIQVGQAAIEGLDLKALTKDFSAWVASVTGQVKGLLLPAFRALGGVIRGALDVVGELWRSAIKPAFDALADRAGSAGDTFKTWRVGAVNAVEAVAQAIGRLGVRVEYLGDLLEGALTRKLSDSLSEWMADTGKSLAKNSATAGFSVMFNQAATGIRPTKPAKPPFDLDAAIARSDKDIAAWFDKVRKRADQPDQAEVVGFWDEVFAMGRRQKQLGMDLGTGQPPQAASRELPKAAEFGSAEAARIIAEAQGKGADQQREMVAKIADAVQQIVPVLFDLRNLAKTPPLAVANL